MFNVTDPLTYMADLSFVAWWTGTSVTTVGIYTGGIVLTWCSETFIYICNKPTA